MRSRLFALALAFSAVFPVLAQTSFTGTWKATEVGFAPWTFVFKPDGATSRQDLGAVALECRIETYSGGVIAACPRAKHARAASAARQAL